MAVFPRILDEISGAANILRFKLSKLPFLGEPLDQIRSEVAHIAPRVSLNGFRDLRRPEKKVGKICCLWLSGTVEAMRGHVSGFGEKLSSL